MFEDTPIEPEYTFDFSNMGTTTDIATMHQEGNWLIGTTTLGVTFRHHIPVDKMLVRHDGKWGLETLDLRA